MIRKLFLDHRFQRRGYGAATLDAVVGYLRTRPGTDELYTSRADGPGSPRGFYLRLGVQAPALSRSAD